MAKQNPKYEIARPEPESFLQSARSFGYSVDTAIADLIDNSITAKATEIKITYGIDRYSSFVRIEDNGKGMTEKEMTETVAAQLFAVKTGQYR